MNRNNRTYLLITKSLDRLELALPTLGGASPDEIETLALDAIGLLDELRRLRRKWDEQLAEGNPRRSTTDFRTHDQWIRRWQLAARTLQPHVKDASIAMLLDKAMTSIR